MGPPFYMVIRATQRSSHLQCKGVPLWFSYFLRPCVSIGLAPGIHHLPPSLRAVPTELILPKLHAFDLIYYTLGA